MKKEFLTKLSRVDRDVSVFLADTPCPRERATGSWGVEVMVVRGEVDRRVGGM